MLERHRVFDEISKLQIEPISVIKAFDGRKRLKFESAELRLFAGTFGCLLSHLTIYLHCHEKKIERALIFEDDAQIVDLKRANQALSRGERSNADICCFSPESSNNRFINTHAYSMSLKAMRACLSEIDSISQRPLNIHIDQLIEYTRRRLALSYRSLRHSSIVQDKELPFTTKWGFPKSVGTDDIASMKRALTSNPFEVLRVLETRQLDAS